MQNGESHSLLPGSADPFLVPLAVSFGEVAGMIARDVAAMCSATSSTSMMAIA